MTLETAKLLKEVWLPINKTDIDYTGLYEISNKGRVKSLTRKSKVTKTNILHPHKTKSGYYSIDLTKLRESKKYRVHRLVALHFIANSGNKPFVNHLNLVKTDNTASNLEWVTHRENIDHAMHHNAFKGVQGSKNNLSRFGDKSIRKIRRLYSLGISQSKLSKQFNTGSGNICMIVNRKTWKHI